MHVCTPRSFLMFLMTTGNGVWDSGNSCSPGPWKTGSRAPSWPILGMPQGSAFRSRCGRSPHTLAQIFMQEKSPGVFFSRENYSVDHVALDQTSSRSLESGFLQSFQIGLGLPDHSVGRADPATPDWWILWSEVATICSPVRCYLYPLHLLRIT